MFTYAFWATFQNKQKCWAWNWDQEHRKKNSKVVIKNAAQNSHATQVIKTYGTCVDMV